MELPVIQPTRRTGGEPPIFQKIGIVGLGLIGGSIALAARELWPASLVIAVDNQDVLDRLMAFLSHLPQLTASALMQVVGDAVGHEGLALSGRGLADTTRLAASPADIWRDITATNADHIGPALDALIAVLQDLRRD